MKIKKHDAVLTNWVVDQTHPIVWGYVFNDRKKRFFDNTWIHTSIVPALKNGDKLKEGMVIQTLNSTYLLGKPMKAEPVAANDNTE